MIAHLSGSRRGLTQKLSGGQFRIGSFKDADIIVDQGLAQRELSHFATLKSSGPAHELQKVPGAQIWVNGKPVDHINLDSGDVIEIGQNGTILRFRRYEAGKKNHKTVKEAFTDCYDCARLGSDKPLKKFAILLAGVPKELLTQTSPLARAVLIALMVVVMTSIAFLWNRNISLEKRLSIESKRVEGLAALLEKTERESFTQNDYAAIRDDFEGRLSNALDRLRALESRAGAAQRAIAAASRSVVFLQGAYGFVHMETGLNLRYLPIETGRPPPAMGNQPPVTVYGNGPIVEVFYTGSGFLTDSDGLLLTNNHVAQPWLFDPSAQAVMQQGFRPEMRRLIGYFPEIEEAFVIELLRASESADLALMKCDLRGEELVPLEFSDSAPLAGDQVIVLGYPAGMRALMARADPAVVQTIMAGGPVGFWELALGLSKGRHIAPLATQGIVGQVTSKAVVYSTLR